jgi:hypothetical protein
MASKSVTWSQTSETWTLRGSMSKYSYKGRRKVVERFTNWHGLGILVVIGGIMGGLLLLWMLGYLHFDAH